MKRLEIPRRPGVGRTPANHRASDAAVRAFVHEVVNPIAAIRISLSALRARATLTERDLADIRRIEEAAGAIVHLVTTMAPPRERPARTSSAADLGRSLDLYLLCCEMADIRRFSEGTIIHCRAFGDPRGDWDREQVAEVLSRLLDQALSHVGQTSPVTISVTGMARHVRVDIHALGWRSVGRRETSLDVSSKIGPAPPGAVVSAIAAPNGGVVFRLRLPRWNLAARERPSEITTRSERP